MPEPLRGVWLLSACPAIALAILADPAGAIQAHGFAPLILSMGMLALGQVWAIRSEIAAKGWA
jgi:hypothetical protein